MYAALRDQISVGKCVSLGIFPAILLKTELILCFMISYDFIAMDGFKKIRSH